MVVVSIVSVAVSVVDYMDHHYTYPAVLCIF